jgi:branched-chain amino acid transport system permease protein
MGIAGIPKYVGLTPFKAFDASILLALVVVLGAALKRTTFCKRVRALRDDEVLASELGLKPARVRWVLWVVSSAILSLVGGMYAFHLRYIDPSSFTVRESVAILAMALMIPAPKMLNASLGALVFIALPEVLRFLGLPSSIGAEVRQLLFGIALVVVVARACGASRGLFTKE